METVNRGKLCRLAKEGKLVCVNSYRFDDYSGPQVGKQELPVRMKEGHGDWKEGYINLNESDFKGKPGRAWKNADGTICLYIHSNLNYDLKIV